MRAFFRSKHDFTAGLPGRDKPNPWRVPARHFRLVTMLGFLLATGLLVLVIAMAYHETRRQIDSSESVIHTREVLSAIEGYTTALRSAQIAVLDYYKNGSEQQIKVFEEAEASVHVAIDHVRQLTVDSPEQQRRLADLESSTNQGVALLRKVIELHRNGQTGAKGLEGLNEEGQKVSAPLLRALKALTGEENQILKERSTQQAVASRRALRLELWGGIFATLLMLGVLGVFLRESSDRMRAEEQLREANADLEQRVRDRTADVERMNKLLRQEIAERTAAEENVRLLNSDLEQRVAERTTLLEVANQELEAFCYSVSHDLRAPLRHIDGFSKILMEDFRSDLDPEALHCLNHIQQAIHNMGHLVDGLLNLSRLSRKDMSRQRVVLGELVEEARAELEPDIAGRNVSWQIGVLPTVLGDPFLLKQVFVNLLANAIKFTRLREPAVIQVSQQATNGETIIFVRDNGVGFNMKYAEKLFGVFQRLHAPEQFEGTGVGLATVQRIIHKHGGRIWAESEPDQGACFFFSLAARPVSTVGVYPVSDKMTS